MIHKQLATAWTESPRRDGPVLGIKPPTSQPPFSAWCWSEEPRGPYEQRAGWTSCLCWKGLDLESVVTEEQVIRLDKSKLPCMAAAIEATSPAHTSGASAEGLPPLLSYLPGSPASHFCSTKLQAGSKLCFEGLLPVAWEVSEEWCWHDSGQGRVFQVDLPLGVGRGPSHISPVYLA